LDSKYPTVKKIRTQDLKGYKEQIDPYKNRKVIEDYFKDNYKKIELVKIL